MVCHPGLDIYDPEKKPIKKLIELTRDARRSLHMSMKDQHPGKPWVNWNAVLVRSLSDGRSRCSWHGLLFRGDKVPQHRRSRKWDIRVWSNQHASQSSLVRQRPRRRRATRRPSKRKLKLQVHSSVVEQAKGGCRVYEMQASC